MTTSELGDAAPASEAAVAPPIGSVVPWGLPVLRAVPALAAAVVITFTGGHSAQYGLIAFAGWAGATAVTDLVAWRVLPKGLPRTAALGRAVAGLLGALVAGLAAVGALGAMHDVERTAMLALTAAATLLIGGMLDAGVGVKTKGLDAYSRDWTTAGWIQVLAAIGVMFVPPGLEHRYQVEDVDGLLTGAIIVVGLLGVTAAILGVLLTIAGISLRSQQRATAALGDGPSGAGAPVSDEDAPVVREDAPVVDPGTDGTDRA